MKDFLRWMAESVSVHVKDYHGSGFTSIYDLARDVGGKVRNLPGAKQATNQEFLTIDGYDTAKTDGILNFYVAGIPQNNLAKILSAVEYYLKDAGAQVGSVKHDKSNLFRDEPVIRIPVKITAGPRAPEVNMANQMAFIIFHDILNMPNSTNLNSFEMSAADLLIKLGQVNDLTVQAAIKEPEKRGIMVSGGVDEDRIRRHLDGLEKLAKWALENDYTELSFS